MEFNRLILRVDDYFTIEISVKTRLQAFAASVREFVSPKAVAYAPIAA